MKIRMMVMVAALAMVCGVAMAWDMVNVSADGLNVKSGTMKIGGVVVTPVAGISTNATITKSSAAITATAAVTKQTFVPAFMLADGTTNTVAIMTNATAAITIVNGASVVTNIVLTIP